MPPTRWRDARRPRARPHAYRPGRRREARQPALRGPRAAAARAGPGAPLWSTHPRPACPRRVNRRRRAPSSGAADRDRRPDGDRTTSGSAGRPKDDEPRDRTVTVRDYQDDRNASGARLRETRNPLPHRSRRGARRSTGPLVTFARRSPLAARVDPRRAASNIAERERPPAAALSFCIAATRRHQPLSGRSSGASGHLRPLPISRSPPARRLTRKYSAPGASTCPSQECRFSRQGRSRSSPPAMPASRP